MRNFSRNTKLNFKYAIRKMHAFLEKKNSSLPKFWKCQVLINLELPKTVSHFSGILHVSHPTLTNWSFFNSVQFSLLYYYYTTVLLLVAPKKNIVVWCINFPLISINYAYLIIEKQDNCQETCVWSRQAGSIRIICTIMLVVVVCTTATMLYCIE